MLSLRSHTRVDIRIVVQFAIFTRALSLVLQAALNAIIPDHEADAFSPPRTVKPRLLDYTTDVLLGGLGRWDAEHFLFIAEHGYVYEHNFAFFPLFPLVLYSVASTLLWPLSPFLTLHGRLLLAVAIANTTLFVLSAVALFGLSCAVLQDRSLALLSSLIYCLTPANVFMLSGYSETLFAALTFGGLWFLEKGFTLRACLFLCLATGARANGLVNAGFLLYLPLQRSLAQACVLSKGSVWHSRCHYYIVAALRYSLTSALCITVVVLPFGLFQLYGYYTFCRPTVTQEQVPDVLLNLADKKGYRVPDEAAPTPSWCLMRIPILYSYIQDVYWDVGFLRYFKLKQIPNFLLALPIATLSVMALYMYIKANPLFCLHLGLGKSAKKGKEGKPPANFYSSKVLTRFLASSSPVVYWISGHVLLCNEPSLLEEKHFAYGKPQDNLKQCCIHSYLVSINNPITQLLMHWNTCSFRTRCILGYFVSYWLLGLVLHCNFLPWT
ncbi:GPI mannosyltransferase 2 isoform X2 [Electrophorus electricus]|uniref:GPI mannosyltransferase 2 isoform X2 n=1 Tax=Electrophorus electricus TaxID=8005 RepID=UPI0015CF9605|nr:GPI mannosyltransferase 2 isoform X2 [Electrophorus electricus]